MKNQYVGDIGDYGKYSLLKSFVDAGVRVGVNWYLTKDDDSNDGKFTKYLLDDGMRYYDPIVFDTLKIIVDNPNKTVGDIEDSGILGETDFYDDVLCMNSASKQKSGIRKAWFNTSMLALSDAKLVFLDPDNGLLKSDDPSVAKAEKYVLPSEVEEYYFAGHNVVYYCHKGRRKYDAWKNYLNHMFVRLPDAKPIVLTYHKGTQRSYVFVVHEEYYKQYRKIIDPFKRRWGKLFTEEYIDMGDTGGMTENEG